LPGIDARELIERSIERDELALSRLNGPDAVVQRHLHPGSGTLGRLLFAGVIDKDSAHHLRRHREEVRAILPGDAVLPHEPHERLMHQRGGLQRVVGPFAAQIRAGPPLQLAVDDPRQIVAGLQIATAPCFQQAADRAGLTLCLIHDPQRPWHLAAFGAVMRQSIPTFRVSTHLPLTPGREDQGDEMRKLALLMLFNVVLGHGAGPLGRAHAAEPETTGTRVPKVRSHSPEVAALIRRASDASATFRRLTATIEDTDGLIYVDDGKCGHGVAACLLLAVQVSGPFRVLWIKVDVRRLDCALMAQIGHELQHAVEILSDPHVTDGVGAYFLFDRLAPGRFSDRGSFETAAAERAGLDVRHEACNAKGR